MRGRRVRRAIVWPVIGTAGLVAIFVALRLGTANFATVEPGRIYRSGQMTARSLARTVRAERIKTVLNLRGDNSDQAWYRAERSATLKAGATQVDLHLASDMWLSRDQARTLVHILDQCDYPLLVHCEWGAERTGLVSAMAALLRPGGSLAEARRQFSLYYLFVKAGDGAVMAEHIDRYADWLRTQHLAHAPEHFRRWIARDYRPAGASRELWPYDPYPVVITRPEAQAIRLDLGRRGVRK